MADFYNNLLGIEITILGIIAAGIFVFIQILHSNFSYKDVTLSLRRISLIAYSSISSVLIFVTGLGALHFAISPHNLIPRWDLNTNIFFENDITLSLIFCGLLLSIALGIYIIFESIKLLNPTFLLQRHLNNAKSESISKLLYHKYGVSEPLPPINILVTIQGVAETDEEKAAREAEKEEKKRQFEKESKETEQLKEASKDAPDVLEGFENLLLRAISLGDRGVVKNGLADYEAKIKEVLKNADESFPVHHLATYVSENLQITLEACRKHNVLSLAPQIVRTSYNIAAFFVESHPNEIDEILKEWKSQADTSIDNSDRLIFRELIKCYRDVGDLLLDQKKESSFNDPIDNVFRNLGWLAERLLAKRGIEEKPLMHDDDYEDEFGAIYNALFHFEYKYSYNKSDVHPLILFDAIHVLYDSLLEVYKKSKEETLSTINKRADIKDWLYSCAYAYYSFADNAIKVSNGDGFSLAGAKLREVYKTAQTAGEEDLARNILELIVRYAIQGASNPDKLVGESYGVNTVVEYAEEIIVSSPYRDTIQSAVFESFIKQNDGDNDKKIEYIKSLGTKMDTNFGLNLD